MPAIGIDLGTTFSCVAARNDRREEVFKNDSGNFSTPSCVTFAKNQTLIGEPAKHLMIEEPENTIYSIKRIIGRKFDDPKTQEDIRRWQFKVERSDSGRPQIKISQHQATYNIEEISGLVLDYMRRIACKKLDEDVRDAVVTVPAYFNHMQRKATKNAAELAGLNVLRIINEPTAAAIGFGLVKKYSENCNILVYDFGGGTFDVTVLNINGSEFNVKASSGDSHLGGDDLTSRVVDHFIEHMRKNMGKEITKNKHALSKLWVECEKAKIELSYRFEYKLYIENIVDGVTLNKTMHRGKFDSLNKDLLEKTMDYVKDAIKESGMDKKHIHYVVPVGGSCRIPYVIDMLENYFGSNVVKDDRAPDQTIARGAAVYAAYLKGETLQEISEVHLSEVTPLSLGIELITKKTSFIIRRNTKIPVESSKIHYNSEDGQKVASILVCQGEKKWFKDNEYLDKFLLDITPKPRHEVEIDVEFSLDLDGILNAKATEIEVGRSESTEIDLCGTLENLDIVKLKEKLKYVMQGTEKSKALQNAKDDLKSTLDEIKHRAKQDSQVIDRCEKIEKWLLQNDNILTISEIQQKKKEIKEFKKACQEKEKNSEVQVNLISSVSASKTLASPETQPTNLVSSTPEDIVQAFAAVQEVHVYKSTKEFYDKNVKRTDVYPIDQNPLKGTVMIINNEFVGKPNKRNGSLVDVENLKNLWNQLGFEVTIKHNLRGRDMSCACHKFSQDPVNVNVLVLFIMSHGGKIGGEEFISGEDNREVPTETIISYFTSNNAPHLRGIPKILIFQACRGEDIDQSVEEFSVDEDSTPDRFPQRADMLIVYATQAGYASFRHRQTGSWLINAITAIFMRDSKDTHVLDMLTKVNRAVSSKESRGFVQMSNQHTYLRKNLFLFPGWPN